jgi:hypothetical protein
MGWLIVTILLPLCAPLVALMVFRALPLPVPVSLMATIKDGQLCWVALGFCASALYEVAIPLQKSVAMEWINGVLIGLLTLSAMIATGGAVFLTPPRCPRGVKWYRHFKCLVASVSVTLVAAAFYAVVHFESLRS